MSRLEHEIEGGSPQVTSIESGNPVKKPVLAVDIDEVLAYFMPALVEFHNYTFQTEPSLTPSSFFSYDFHNVWGGSKEATMEKMEAFFVSNHFTHRIAPIPRSLAVLQQLKNAFDLHVVTSRQTKIEAETRSWIAKHYPNIFTELHFGNHYALQGTSRSKPDMCRDIGAVLLIDDSLRYAWQCVQARIPVLLFGDYAWNQLTSQPVIPQLQEAVGNGSMAIKDFSALDLVASAARKDTSSVIYRVTDWSQVLATVDIILGRTVVSTTAVAAPALRGHLLQPLLSSETAVDRENNVLVVAAIQMCSSNSKIANLRRTRRLVQAAVTARADVAFICLPECSAFMGNSAAETLAAAEEIDLAASYPELQCAVDAFYDDCNGSYISSSSSSGSESAHINYVAGLCQIAFTYKVWLSVGGFPERRTTAVAATAITAANVSSDVAKVKMSNTHFLISPQGNIASPLYRKIHLFDSPLAGLFESKSTIAGDDLVVAPLICSSNTASSCSGASDNTAAGSGSAVQRWNVGLSICYDLRFPELYQKLRYGPTALTSVASSPADVILVPSAFTVKTGQAHWEVLLRARAIETQSYVVAAAQAGKHNEKRTSYGHTIIIDPWGAVVASLEDEEEGICFCDMDKRVISATREAMPIQNHRRLGGSTAATVAAVTKSFL